MAQHDQNIADGSGVIVRSDINDAIAALWSLNSGATAPSVTVAYMWWADTANGVLKQRNAANTAWIYHGALGEAFLRYGDIAAGGSGGLLRADGDGSGLTGLGVLPVGSVFLFGGDEPPTGALAGEGAAISRTTYANLFSVYGETFGAGDGSTTFNLPDLRGEFIRGWDNGRGVDDSRAFGSAQSDAFASHTHSVPRTSVQSPGGLGHYGGVNTLNGFLNTTAVGSTETRPRNIALLACIKY